MLRLQNVSLVRGVRVLYKNVNLTTSDGEIIGLVGPNGSGKSTLFAAILGELSTEDGDILAPPLNRISHVAQRVVETDLPALEYILEGHAPLMEARAELKRADKAGDDMAYAQAVAHLAEINEGAVVAKAEEILYGLGFKPNDSSRKVSEFSGGWRNRIALARALMRPADLLLLDEPTNHLDIDSVIWLESFLKQQEATVIVISHDREFLDRIAKSIWSVEDNTINRYGGNYSQFEVTRAQKLALQQAAAKAYERTASHLQAYIDRFRYKATKARQAQSRIKMLEKLQSVEPVLAKNEWRFSFLQPEKVPQHLITAEGLACGYEPDHPILTQVKCNISAGARIGILGVNGAGKSTLVKTLIGELKPLAGEIRYGQGLEIGYFAQHQLNDLRDDESPLQHLTRIAPPNMRELDLRNFLGKFRFSGDQALSPVGPMSGGEKARLSLALIAWNKPNLLVLDEPTNHLDMETREALTVALSSYEGAVLLVSHDRHLLRASCDELWLVRDGKLSEFDGDLDEYAEIVLKDKKARNAAPEDSGAPAPVNRKEQRRNEAQERARISALSKPLKKELSKIEKELDLANKEKSALDLKLADTDFYQGNQEEVAEALKRHGELSSKIDELEGRWLEISEELQNISSSSDLS